MFCFFVFSARAPVGGHHPRPRGPGHGPKEAVPGLGQGPEEAEAAHGQADRWQVAGRIFIYC